MKTIPIRSQNQLLPTVACASLLITVSQAMVSNGGFESEGSGGTTDADSWSEAVGVSSRSNDFARTGTWAIKSTGSPVNGFPATSQTISVAGLEGRNYVAGLWALTPSSNPITTGGARLKLVFRDGANAQISQVDPLFFTPSSGQNVWRKGMQKGVIPAGAATVTIQAMHDVGADVGKDIFLDDASFQVLDNTLPLDGGFEVEGTLSSTDAEYWVEQSGSIHTRSNEAARTGAWSIKSSSATTNSFPITFQNVDVSTLNGRGVTATLWAMTPSANPILSGGVRIKMEFFKGAAPLGSAESANFLTTSSTKNTWIQGKLEVVVPPTATTIKFQAMHNVGGTGGGVVYMDDALLSFLPAGTPANGGFETVDTGVADAAFWNEPTGFSRSTELTRSGSAAMKSVGTPANGFPASTQEMLVSGFVGETFTAKLWALTPSSNPITTGGARLKVVFRNSSNADIAGSSQDPVFLSPSSPQDTWVQGTVTGTIPAGAVRVRIQVMHDVGTTTGTTLYFDDASFAIGATDPFTTWASGAGLEVGEDGELDDPDKDGTNNLIEFALNGDPLSGSDQGTLSSSHADSNGNTRKDLALTLAVRTGATFAPGPNGSQTVSIDGITYTIQGSLDLTTFDQTVSFVSKSASASPDYELHRFLLDASDAVSPAAKGFLRVLVTKP